MELQDNITSHSKASVRRDDNSRQKELTGTPTKPTTASSHRNEVTLSDLQLGRMHTDPKANEDNIFEWESASGISLPSNQETPTKSTNATTGNDEIVDLDTLENDLGADGKENNNNHQQSKDVSDRNTSDGACNKLLCTSAAKVVITRVLYLLHVLFTIWRVTEVLGNIFWVMAAMTLTFLIDTVVVIVWRKGKEWTW